MKRCHVSAWNEVTQNAMKRCHFCSHFYDYSKIFPDYRTGHRKLTSPWTCITFLKWSMLLLLQRERGSETLLYWQARINTIFLDISTLKSVILLLQMSASMCINLGNYRALPLCWHISTYLHEWGFPNPLSE